MKQQENSLESAQKGDTLTKVISIVFWLLLAISIVFALVFFLRPEWLKISRTSSLPVIEQNIDGRNIPSETTGSPQPTAVIVTPTPINRPGEYACDPIGICNHYIETDGMGCPKTFAEPTCSNVCGNEEFRCAK